MEVAEYLRDVLVPANVAVEAITRAGLCVDVDRLRATRSAWESELRETERRVEGEFAEHGAVSLRYSRDHGLNSAELSNFLFGPYGLVLPEGVAAETEKGNPSSADEVLSHFASLSVPRPDDVPLVRDVMQIRSLGGAITRYLDALERTRRADGCCHPKYNWALRTARLSAENPPVHGIPERSDRRVADGIKSCIVPRVAPAPSSGEWDPRRHGSCFRWDISGAEAAIRAAMLTAHYVGPEPIAWEYIRTGKDIHAKTASLLYNVPEGTYRKGSHERDTVGKHVFFTKIFGAFPGAVKRTIWEQARVVVSMDEAERFCDAFDAGYVGLGALYEDDKRRLGESMCEEGRRAARHAPGHAFCRDAYGRRRKIVIPAGAEFDRSSGSWGDHRQLHKAFHIAANCVDAETEALTQRGWVKGFDLRRDDILLTKSAVSGGLEWQPLLDLKLWPDYYGPLVEFKSKSLHVVSTPNHRWLVRERYGRGKRLKRDIEVTTATFSPRGEQALHLTGDYRPQITSSLTQDEAELMGWWLTDGSLRACRAGAQKTRGKRTYLLPTQRVVLCQSAGANLDKCRRVDELLSCVSAGERIRRYETPRVYNERPYTYVEWVVGPRLSQKIIALCPRRVLTFDLLCRLDRPALDRLREAMVLGDGCLSGGTVTFCSGSQEQIEAFQALCTLTGAVASIQKRDLGKYGGWTPRGSVSWYSKVLKRTHAQVLHNRRNFTAKRAVWCPVVANTFFVARRSGTVFVTGNTPTQSTNASDNMWMLALCHLGEYVPLRVPPIWERDGVPFPEAAGWQISGGPGPGGLPFQAWHTNTVHDSGWGDCAPGWLEPTAKLVWRRCRAVPLDWRLDADVPYRIDLSCGPDMANLESYNDVAARFGLEPVPDR